MSVPIDPERRQRLNCLTEAERRILKRFVDAGFRPQRMKVGEPVVRGMIMADVLLPPARPPDFDWGFSGYEAHVAMRQWAVEVIRLDPQILGVPSA